MNATPPSKPIEPEAATQGIAVGVSETKTQVFEGPVPHPDILNGFEQVIPGSAREILDMAQAEALHRRTLEVQATQANIEAQRRQLDLAAYQSRAVFRSDTVGQVFGLIVSLACVAGAVYLALHGQPWVAGALAGIPTAAVIQAFFARRSAQK